MEGKPCVEAQTVTHITKVDAKSLGIDADRGMVGYIEVLLQSFLFLSAIRYLANRTRQKMLEV